MPFDGYRSDHGASWAPINEPFNSWVAVGDLQVCVRYENSNPDDHPIWGVTGEDNEEITRHILCCEMDNALGDASAGATEEELIAKAYASVSDIYDPKWFSREDGWQGKTYHDALAFCAAQSSYIPCPYEVRCLYLFIAFNATFVV